MSSGGAAYQRIRQQSAQPDQIKLIDRFLHCLLVIITPLPHLSIQHEASIVGIMRCLYRETEVSVTSGSS